MNDPTASHPLPAQDLILIGTARTCSQLAGQLSSTPGSPTLLGSVIVDDMPLPSGAGPALGSVHDLDQILSTINPGQTLALISLTIRLRATWLRVNSILARRGVRARTVTPIEDILAGDPAAWGAGPAGAVDYAALIGRTPYGINRKAVEKLIQGKRVLITGAGGSIGSEIARIVATFSPSKLILMERSENALFEINRKIGERFPGLARAAILHDVVDAPGTLRKLMDEKPHVVFHAAAHKHVPLMEDHPAHAVTNNFFGTKSIADAALACGAERFVLISSDKAVKPTSVMGATKRLAEMYIQALHRSVWSRRQLAADTAAEGKTAFCMVRFGNVLGSACSVLPIWSSQLAEGGPVTVTDPRMTRYFMTIDEAAALVIQAGAIGTSNPTAHVYVLDMGEPVRILDLARRFVAAAGFRPRVEEVGGEAFDEPGAFRGDPHLPEMTIRLTGARPGEKLHEELAYAAELLQPTTYAGINAWAGPLGGDFSLASLVSDLNLVAGATDRATVLGIIRKHIPELPMPENAVQSPNMLTESKQNTLHNTNTTIAVA